MAAPVTIGGAGHPLLVRYEEGRKRVEQHWRLLEEAFEYALPQLGLFKAGGPGTKRTDLVFDSTAPQALIDLAAELQGDLIPPFEEWLDFDLEPSIKRQVTPEQLHQVQLALDEERESIFEELRRSNFDVEASEAFLQLVGSTGVLLVQEGDDRHPLRFEAVPVDEVVPEPGPFGTLETMYRAHTKKARDLARYWPDGRWSRDVQELIKRTPDGDVTVLEATVYDPERDRWDYRVIEAGGHEAVADDFEVSPWIAFRWGKAPREVLGRGPLLHVLPDIKTLNKIVELELENASLAIAGVYLYDNDGVLNPASIELAPGTFIPRMPNSKVDALPTTASFQVSQVKAAEIREIVRTALFGSPLPPAETGDRRTAYEMAQRVQERTRRQGPPAARLYSEFVVPLVRRVRHILRRRGILPAIMVGDREIRPVPVSPLARLAALQQVAEADAALAGALAFDDGSVARVVDMEGYQEWRLQKVHFPGQFLRPAAERQRIAAADAEQQAAMQLSESKLANTILGNLTAPRGAP